MERAKVYRLCGLSWPDDGRYPYLVPYERATTRMPWLTCPNPDHGNCTNRPIYEWFDDPPLRDFEQWRPRGRPSAGKEFPLRDAHPRLQELRAWYGIPEEISFRGGPRCSHLSLDWSKRHYPYGAVLAPGEDALLVREDCRMFFEGYRFMPCLVSDRSRRVPEESWFEMIVEEGASHSDASAAPLHRRCESCGEFLYPHDDRCENPFVEWNGRPIVRLIGTGAMVITRSFWEQLPTFLRDGLPVGKGERVLERSQ